MRGHTILAAAVRRVRRLCRSGLAGLAGLALGLGLGFALPASPAAAQALPADLQAAWKKTGLPLSALSLQVREVGGRNLLSVDAGSARNPASVMKMVTTWAGLLGLGPEYRWRTGLLLDKGVQVDGQGSLAGPLYIRASGDPQLSVQDLWSLLRELRLRGIKNLSEVVIDRSIFGAVTIDTGAFDGEADRPYNASPDALMVGLGALRLFFYPDTEGRKWVAVPDPAIPGLQLEGGLAWGTGACPGPPRPRTRIDVRDGQARIALEGEVAAGCDAFSAWRVALDQPAYFAQVFRLLWRELGGTLARDIRDGTVPADARLVAWHDSPPLADLIRKVNKLSNNVMARNLLLSLGAAVKGPGATPASGAQAALELLAAEQVDVRGWFIDNGAGLSRSARLTAGGLADMLDKAWHSPLMPEFVSSLAISGVDGTMRRRLGKSAARGMAHLKTGTLRDARALAGYVQGRDGKRYILVSLVNHDQAIAARVFEDALVAWLVARQD
ncbi:MAG: D-alanyl-D-alanine carboxypeptidase/D-alanyl-D-alanine-endopeptidase [Castellaniella sp.]